MGCVRIRINVELGRRSHVAKPDRAPHGHDLGNVVEDRRVLDDRKRDVGERPERSEGHRTRRLAKRLH